MASGTQQISNKTFFLLLIQCMLIYLIIKIKKNSTQIHHQKFSFKVFASYLQFCGIGLRNAQLYEKSQLEVKRNQVLLDLARMIFEEQSTIEHMVFRILTHMQSLIQCQRVQVRENDLSTSK